MSRPTTGSIQLSLPSHLLILLRLFPLVEMFGSKMAIELVGIFKDENAELADEHLLLFGDRLRIVLEDGKSKGDVFEDDARRPGRRKRKRG